MRRVNGRPEWWMRKQIGNLLIGMRLAFGPASHQCLAHRIRNHAPKRAFQSSNAQPVYCLPPFTRRSLYRSPLRTSASFFPLCRGPSPPELLLRNSMCKVLDRNKFETKRSGVFAQGVLTAAKMFFVEDSQQFRVERTAVTEHGKKNARQFVSSGGDSHRGAVFGTKSAKIVTQRRAAAI
jgi:hypothetical protein